VNLDEKDAGAPIDVPTDSSGHFIIQGVKPGGSYKLIARTKLGEKLLAGTVLTDAPNVRVLIPIREDLANADTPPIPGSPALAKPEKTGTTKDSASWNAKPPPQGTTPNLPTTVTVPTAPVGNPVTPAAGDPLFLPGIAEAPNSGPPMLKLPSAPRPEPLQPVLPAPGDAHLNTGPTRVPSCLLIGNRLENMALKDSKGQTWEYKKQAAGKLLLIDFWGTHCQPCMETMPTLAKLQAQYGSRGLEVIGIALEPAKDERKDAEKVNKVAASMQLNYRQLMGHTGNFDVANVFRIKGLPTLILVNEQGDIIYQHEGRPDASAVRVLEGIIQRRVK
jgi:thiol-disulfide isomerase/thioredoxin